MKNRLSAFVALLSALIFATPSVLAQQGSDQGLPPGGVLQLQPMQPTMGTQQNYAPGQTGAPAPYGNQQGGYPSALQTPQGGGYQPPQQYQGQQYAPPPQQYQGQQYQGQQTPQYQGQAQQFQGQQQYQVPTDGYAPGQVQQGAVSEQGQSPYQQQEQAIQQSQMQNQLDKYAPPPEVGSASPDSYKKGRASKGSGKMKGVVGGAGKMLTHGARIAAPMAASLMITTAAYKMAQSRNGYGYGGGYGGGYGMPMGGYGMPMGGYGMPGMGMYGMPGMGVGMPMGGYRMPGW